MFSPSWGRARNLKQKNRTEFQERTTIQFTTAPSLAQSVNQRIRPGFPTCEEKSESYRHWDKLKVEKLQAVLHHCFFGFLLQIFLMLLKKFFYVYSTLRFRTFASF